jgi:hypothetical protein
MASRQSPRGRRRSVMPNLEPLEGRCLPACTVTPTALAVTVLGDAGANTVVIDDDGAGAITVTCDGAVHGPFPGIRFATVVTGPGNDAVSYNLNDDLLAGQLRFVSAVLGRGNDSFRARSREISAGADADLNLNAQLSFEVTGGKGRDTFAFDFSKDFDINAGAGLFVGVNGGPGRDRATVDVLGRLQGSLTLTANGNQDRDKMAATIGLGVGSTGLLFATVSGQGGDDLLGLVVSRSRDVTTTVTGRVSGGGGVNQAIVSDAVLVTGVSGANLLRYPA